MVPTRPEGDSDPRVELCLTLGFEGIIEVHGLVMAGAKGAIEKLTAKGLKAKNLTRLGYSASALKALGYDGKALEKLGFKRVVPKGESAEGGVQPRGADTAADSTVDTIRELIGSGTRATALKSKGFTLHQCRKAGFSARELDRIGFDISLLRSEFTILDLKRAGYSARELRKFFRGHELRSAGFTGDDMRSAGFTIRDLQQFGYNDNKIITAGFTIVELAKAGLSRQTSTRRIT